MVELADIFQKCSPAYLAKYGHKMPPVHQRAMRDITLCRTETLGGQLFYCQKCEDYRYSYHSCKNRHCPKCGNSDTSSWLAAQNALLMPVVHFMITVTLPAPLRRVARSHQKRIYELLFHAGAKAIQKLAHDPKFVGGQVGIIAVLQTWTRDLRYHPHVHFIVPACGLSDDDKLCLPDHPEYLMPHKALARIIRGIFRDALKKTDLFDSVPKDVWNTDWVVDIRPVGKGQSALKYLAPYIFRVAITNKRILKFEDGKVTFQYQNSDDQWLSQTLPAETFIHRFLQHVLPKRFVKVRYYGFLSPRKRYLLDRIKLLFVPKPEKILYPTNITTEAQIMRCPKCGNPLVFVQQIKPQKWRPP